MGIPILRLRDDFLAIATLGFGILIRVLLDNSDRFIEVLGGSRGFIGIPKIVNLEVAFCTIVFLVLVTRNLIFSRYGLLWQCIKDDELLRLRSRIGEPVALVALRRYLARPDARVGHLLDLAETLDVLGPVRSAVDVLTAS